MSSGNGVRPLKFTESLLLEERMTGLEGKIETSRSVILVSPTGRFLYIRNLDREHPDSKYWSMQHYSTSPHHRGVGTLLRLYDPFQSDTDHNVRIRGKGSSLGVKELTNDGITRRYFDRRLLPAYSTTPQKRDLSDTALITYANVNQPIIEYDITNMNIIFQRR